MFELGPSWRAETEFCSIASSFPVDLLVGRVVGSVLAPASSAVADLELNSAFRVEVQAVLAYARHSKVGNSKISGSHEAGWLEVSECRRKPFI